jgi:hypothetical protein
MIKIPKARKESEWTETDRNQAAWNLYKSIVMNKMAQDNIWEVQWHESIATTLTAGGEEPELQKNQITDALNTLMPTAEQETTEYASTDEDNPDDTSPLPPGPYRIQLIADSELISKLVNDSTKRTSTEDPLDPDDVVDEFEDVIEDEQILKNIPQSMRGKPSTRQVYAFYSKVSAQAMHRRLEQNIILIHQAMDEADERIGSASWATADNNRSDPLNLAICIPAAQIKNRAFNKNIEEVQSNDDLWAETTLQHVCEDKELVEAMKGVVKEVLVIVPYWRK